MAKNGKSNNPPQREPKPITFVLTDEQRETLQAIGMRDTDGIVLRAKFQDGKLIVTHHQRVGDSEFTPSNAAFA